MHLYVQKSRVWSMHVKSPQVAPLECSRRMSSLVLHLSGERYDQYFLLPLLKLNGLIIF